MSEESVQSIRATAVGSYNPAPQHALNWMQRIWRPGGTVLAGILALLIVWHAIYGKNGITVWQKKRVQDQQLRSEIESLQQENAHLREHIDRLRTDPSAVEHEAREKLHYAKPGEVIYTLPVDPKSDKTSQSLGQNQTAGER